MELKLQAFITSLTHPLISLTRYQTGDLGDAPNNPALGFTTVRFGPGLFGNYGELDIYRHILLTDYAERKQIVAKMRVRRFTYILTLIFATIYFLSFRYTQGSLVEKLVIDAEEKGRKAPSDSLSLAHSSLHRTPSNNTYDTNNPPSPTSSTSPPPSIPGIGCTYTSSSYHEFNNYIE